MIIKHKKIGAILIDSCRVKPKSQFSAITRQYAYWLKNIYVVVQVSQS